MRHMIIIPLVVALGVTAPLNEAYAKDEYLVFRIRAKVDDEGELVSAHYGRIMGELQYLEGGGGWY